MAGYRILNQGSLTSLKGNPSRSKAAVLLNCTVSSFERCAGSVLNLPGGIISAYVPTRSKSSQAPTTSLFQNPVSTLPSAAPKEVAKDTLDLTFNDARAAFRSKTTPEILRAYIVFQLCRVQYLVDNNQKLMKLGRKILGKKMFEKLMHMSFYGHFVAGENQVSIQPQIERMRNFGVKAILDYSVEEDISEDQVNASMKPSAPQTTDSKNVTDAPEGYTRYKADKRFADRREGVGSARTYFYMSEASCEKNMETFLQSIEAVSGATKGTGFAAIKVTALGRPQLLLTLSEAIARVHKYVSLVTGKEGYVQDQDIKPEDLMTRLEKAAKKDPTVQKWLENMTFDKSGLIHVLPWQGVVGSKQKLREVLKVADLKTGEMQNLVPPLTDDEEEMFRNMMRRLHTIFQVATKMDVRVMVDAEQTYFQPAISRIAMEMMRIYNKEKAIVFNTYQCYLKSAYKDLCIDLDQSLRQNFYFGAKLVRGAYMVQERARAAAVGYEDPINENFEATTAMYEKCMLHSLKVIQQAKKTDRPKQFSIMAATHNEDTVRFAIQQMKEHGIEPQDRVICFGQLYGMCDQISFPLGQSGYSVYKYVPYGPVEGVLPYLSRRAQENGGMLQKVEKERRLLFQELRRRILTGQLFYVPKGQYEPL